MSRQGWLGAAAVAMALASAGAARADDVKIVSHREVHEFTPAPTSAAPEVSTVGGRLVSETVGTACGDYTTAERFVMRGVDDQGEGTLTDLRSRAVENGDRLTFTDEDYDEKGKTDSNVGSAERTPQGLRVQMSEPDDESYTLNALPAFPVEQDRRIIAAALAGQHFLSFDVYDGSPDGVTVYSTSTVIGAVSTAADDYGAERAIADAGFAGLRHWPVTVSYYEKKDTADSEATYDVRMVMYENGVRRGLMLTYGDGLVLMGTLSRLEMLPEPSCIR